MEPGIGGKRRWSSVRAAGDVASTRKAAEPRYWLFFNAYGEIGYCSDSLAHLLGQDVADLQGQGVTAILLELPVSRDTPGANIGVLMMNFVGRRMPLELGCDGGFRRPVHATFRSIHLGSGPAFIVEIELGGKGDGSRAGRR